MLVLIKDRCLDIEPAERLITLTGFGAQNRASGRERMGEDRGDNRRGGGVEMRG